MGYLRLILALIVVCAHLQAGELYGAPYSTIIFGGPIVAVKLFFVISGFYMAMVYDRYDSAQSFFWSRAVRLYPMYWLTLAATAMAAISFGSPKIPQNVDFSFWTHARPLGALASWSFANLSFIGLDLGLFVCTNGDVAKDTVCPGDERLSVTYAVVQPAWTLALECYFYLLVPLFFRIGSKVTIAVAAASFGLTLIIYFAHNFNPWTRGFFPAELYVFLLGFLAYRFRDHIPRTWSITVAAIFVLLLLAYQHLPVFDWLNPNGANMILYLAFPVALPAIFQLGQRLPFERLIGDLSYPIYICHMPVECVLYTLRVHKVMTLYPWIALNIFAVIATASLLLYVTGPIERFRQAFKRRRLSGLPSNAFVLPDAVAPAAMPRSVG